jgi:hypothetical protein
MKHEAILEGRELFPRERRVDADYDVCVRCEVGDIDARSSTYRATASGCVRRTRSRVGWEVTLEAADP